MTVAVAVDRTRLKRAYPTNAAAGFRYYEDREGSLYGEREGTQTLRLLAQKGVWTRKAAEGSAPTRREPIPVQRTPRQSADADAPESADRDIPDAPEGVTGTTVPTFRFSFSYRAVLNNVPGTVTVEAATGAALKLKIGEVMQHFTPIEDKPSPHDEYFVFLADGTAFCQKHQAPMTQRSKQGDEWWSHNVGSAEQPCYCRGRPGKDSPGWNK